MVEDNIPQHIEQTPVEVVPEDKGKKFKQAMGKLLTEKPKATDWITIFLILCVLFATYQYVQETTQCKYVMTHLPEVCAAYKYINITIGQPANTFPTMNFTETLLNFSLDQTNG
jgi:hypothetical protein